MMGMYQVSEIIVGADLSKLNDRSKCVMICQSLDCARTLANLNRLLPEGVFWIRLLHMKNESFLKNPHRYQILLPFLFLHINLCSEI